jgi:hypothetical protein
MATATELTSRPARLSLSSARDLVAKVLVSIKLAERVIREKAAAGRIRWNARVIAGDLDGNGWWLWPDTKFDWTDNTAMVPTWPQPGSRPPDWPLGPERVDVLGIELCYEDIVREFPAVAPAPAEPATSEPAAAAPAASSRNKGGFLRCGTGSGSLLRWSGKRDRSKRWPTLKNGCAKMSNASTGDSAVTGLEKSRPCAPPFARMALIDLQKSQSANLVTGG